MNNYTRKEVTYTRINTGKNNRGRLPRIQLRYRLLMMNIACCAMTTSYQEGINIFPVQKTSTHGTELWNVKLSPGREYPKWKISDSGPVENRYDTALILNVTRNIHDDVINYVEESHIPIGRLIDCTLEDNGATNFSIQDGTHASLLANSIYDAI